jgi:hypothetical protein
MFWGLTTYSDVGIANALDSDADSISQIITKTVKVDYLPLPGIQDCLNDPTSDSQ